MDSPTADDYDVGHHGWHKDAKNFRDALKDEVQREMSRLTRGDVYSLADYKALQRGYAGDEDNVDFMSGDTDVAHARTLRLMLADMADAQDYFFLAWLASAPDQPGGGTVPYPSLADSAQQREIRDFARRMRAKIEKRGRASIDADVLTLWDASGLADAPLDGDAVIRPFASAEAAAVATVAPPARRETRGLKAVPALLPVAADAVDDPEPREA